MNRQETILLLTELLLKFESIAETPRVYLSRISDSANWELRVKWTAQANQKDSLNRISEKHGFSITETEGETVFR